MWRRVFVIVAASAGLGACVIPQQPAFDTRMVLPIRKAPDNTVIYSTPQFKSSVAGLYPQPCSDFDNATTPTVTQRNACIIELQREINDAYGQWKIRVNNAISGVNVGFDSAALATGTAAPLLSGVAATVLSALTSAANNGKNVFNQDILYKVTIQILISTMDGLRSKDQAAMRIAMQSPLDAYTMAQAKNDLIDYYYDGTLVQALSKANQDASTVAQKCDAANKAVQKVAPVDTTGALSRAQAANAAAAPAGGATTTSDQCNAITETLKAAYQYTDAGKSLEAFWKPDGKTYNAANEASLKTCMKTVLGSNTDSQVQQLVKHEDLTTMIRTSIVNDSDKASILSCAVNASAAAANPTSSDPAQASSPQGKPKPKTQAPKP